MITTVTMSHAFISVVCGPYLQILYNAAPLTKLSAGKHVYTWMIQPTELVESWSVVYIKTNGVTAVVVSGKVERS